MKIFNKTYFSSVINCRSNFDKICCCQQKLTPMQKRWRTESQLEPAIGLEIHAQIATSSKLFSAASTSFFMPVNTCVSLFDCAMPGTLPVLNRKCVEAGVLTALALSCKVNELSMFERKHYFYADLPAGYQITQQKQPLAVNGKIKFEVFTPGVHKQPYSKSSKLKQVQLEQDSGRSLHDAGRAMSLIDLNRAGIPLMELVFEPDLVDGEEAAALVKELCNILQLLNTCSCKMEEGALRVDANVSVSPRHNELGTRTEIKNISSIRGVASAINYEIHRQISVLQQGGQVLNETRAWDAEKKCTIPMREKEEKQDYRFMPETNLPPLRIHVDDSAENVDNLVNAVVLNNQLPDLPDQIRRKLSEDFQLSPLAVTVLTTDFPLLNLFTGIIEKDKSRIPQLVARFLITDLLHILNKNNLEADFCEHHTEYIGEVVDLLQHKEINLLIAKRLLDELVVKTTKTPRQIVEENVWFVIKTEDKLKEICSTVMAENEQAVKDYKAGKKRAIKPLLRKVVDKSDSCAEMAVATKVMEDLLK